MRLTVRLIATLAVTSVALLAPASAANAAATTAPGKGTVLSFALVTPNSATAPNAGMMAAPGDSVTVTGAGVFAPTAGTVHAGGTFVHRGADGTLRCRGTWKATALTGWRDFGATRGGKHGGVISLLVTHYCETTGMIHTDIPMTVTSTRNTMPGSDYAQGVTVGDFTVPTSGTVAIRGVHHGAAMAKL